MFESLEELEEIRARIVGLARKYGWTIINADKSTLEIHKEIRGFLINRRA